MKFTFADICVIVGTIGIHWHIGNYYYQKIRDIMNENGMD
jgi:hypothetical protein